jgi:hypothetical protein
MRLLRNSLLVLTTLCLLIGLLQMGRRVVAVNQALVNAGFRVITGTVPGASFQLRCAANKRCRNTALEAYDVTMMRFYHWLLYSGVGTLLLYFLTFLFNPKDDEKRKPGHSRWATERDLHEYLHKGSEGPLVSYIGMYKGKLLKFPENYRNVNSLIVGGQGANKTAGILKPQMFMDAFEDVCSVVYDNKFPQGVYGLGDVPFQFASRGKPVYAFCPTETWSLKLPLFKYATDFTAAQEIARQFINDPHEPAYYKNAKVNLLAALFIALRNEPEASFQLILEKLSQGRNGIINYLNLVPDKTAQTELMQLVKMKADHQDDIVKSTRDYLTMFLNDKLNRAFSNSPNPREDLDLEHCFSSPGLLYLAFDEEIKHYHRTLYLLLYLLIDKAMIGVKQRDQGRMPFLTNIYLDEFVTFGYNPTILDDIAKYRASRINFSLVVQDFEMLGTVYSEAEKNALIALCKNKVFFPRFLSEKTSEYLEKACSKVTVSDVSSSQMEGGVLDKRRGHLQRNVGRSLITTAEMKTWQKHAAVALLVGCPPVQMCVNSVHKRFIKPFLRNPFYAMYKQAGGINYDTKAFLKRYTGLVVGNKLANGNFVNPKVGATLPRQATRPADARSAAPPTASTATPKPTTSQEKKLQRAKAVATNPAKPPTGSSIRLTDIDHLIGYLEQRIAANLPLAFMGNENEVIKVFLSEAHEEMSGKLAQLVTVFDLKEAHGSYGINRDLVVHLPERITDPLRAHAALQRHKDRQHGGKGATQGPFQVRPADVFAWVNVSPTEESTVNHNTHQETAASPRAQQATGTMQEGATKLEEDHDSSAIPVTGQEEVAKLRSWITRNTKFIIDHPNNQTALTPDQAKGLYLNENNVLVKLSLAKKLLKMDASPATLNLDGQPYVRLQLAPQKGDVHL